MIRLVDVVNFNADASCLRSSDWLNALKGGVQSIVHQWLEAYLEHRRRVVLGFTGSTIGDLLAHNPEAVALVAAHPATFQLVLRPYAHDVALLRSTAGFALNFRAGRLAVERSFSNVAPYFLPAEFMLTNGQVRHLALCGVAGTFVNSSRFKNELRTRIPRRPYFVRGVFGSRLRCLPFQERLTESYLTSLHLWDGGIWNRAIADAGEEIVFSWRDGESFLFIPNGLARERAWLAAEDQSIQRAFLTEVESDLRFEEQPTESESAFRSYPVHSFADWIRESRMLGYLNRINSLEQKLGTFDTTAVALWLQVINSDVFSAVEKDSPVVVVRASAEAGARDEQWTIRRSERGMEGEEFVELLEAYLDYPAKAPDLGSGEAHLLKLRGRLQHLSQLLA